MTHEDQQIDLIWRTDYHTVLQQLEAQKNNTFFNSFLVVAMFILQHLRDNPQQTLTYRMVIDQVCTTYEPECGWAAVGGFNRELYVSHYIPMAVEALKADDIMTVLKKH